ncbi:MAG: iron chelate uptake ABC transporter family permease subunit [Nitrososphaeria archaeon]|nr:iron chelate uptake ABC transporter family permease subunit [Nitrososphaeria archaeon]NIN52175.1 iron chelate uptake ABC transporter family permease subunit [Nitrososphaeria archaeon]NIQ32628.1 iron chelate uptake ABC transporter family permease subunit [Nitrososphaeria archaeon]
MRFVDNRRCVLNRGVDRLRWLDDPPSNHRVLIPASLLVGAITLVICDAVAWVVFTPTELPVGMITTMSGGPFFLYLLRKKKGKYQF